MMSEKEGCAMRLSPEYERTLIERMQRANVGISWSETLGRYIGSFLIDPKHVAPDRSMNGEIAKEIVSMRPDLEKVFSAIRDACRTVHDSVRGEDPFIYTACTSAALNAVLLGMDLVRGAVFSWAEANPIGDGHMHSISFVRNSCACEQCTDNAEGMVRSLHEWATQEPGRTRELFERLRAQQGAPRKETLQ